MRIALIQTNPTIGAIDANTEEICRLIAEAQQTGADLAIFPEQAIIGYPAKDLLLRGEIIQRNLAALERGNPRVTVAGRDAVAERLWEISLRAQRIEELEAELARHPDKNANAQWAIELLASGRYKRYTALI